jgi:hypothetical protein
VLPRPASKLTSDSHCRSNWPTNSHWHQLRPSVHRSRQSPRSIATSPDPSPGGVIFLAAVGLSFEPVGQGITSHRAHNGLLLRAGGAATVLVRARRLRLVLFPKRRAKAGDWGAASRNTAKHLLTLVEPLARNPLLEPIMPLQEARGTLVT